MFWDAGSLIMRFIGSKAALLDKIEAVIDENTGGNGGVFCDMFSGTGIVARFFKPKYEIISNDSLYFSYVIQRATIGLNGVPDFLRLKKIGINDPFRFLEETPTLHKDDSYFILNNYSPSDTCNRMYVSGKNAARIDFIRITIEAWKNEGLLTEEEYYYLLACLVEGVPSVSNITGTYGAYLKAWDKRAFNDLQMVRLDVADNGRENCCYNMDANELVRQIEGDILYLDPPYNSRQYAPNYHLLETIARYDYPELSGVTGMRPYDELKSPYCVKGEVAEAFEDLVANAKFENIVLSYSTDGLMTEGQIEEILKRHGDKNSYRVYHIPYRQYMSKKTKKAECLYEYLFYIKKGLKNTKTFTFSGPKPAKKETKPVLPDKKKYIKSPMNYIGGKYKLLPQIMPLFPGYIGTFVDLFSGGCNVAINVNADRIICNDINSKVIELFETFKNTDLSLILEKIDGRIEEYGLSKENESGFIRFRNYYNEVRDPIDLYTLTCYSFNYQFRFNNNLEYNNPFGRNRSQFSKSMKNNLVLFVTKLQELNIEFKNEDFENIMLEGLTPDDFIYCDPPYFITTGTYNDGNRGFKDWKQEQELALYDYLDRANGMGIKFALSNVIEHKGRKNEILSDWAQKYKIIDIQSSYSNSSYNTRKGESREVLVINY